jgi:hypothetical protein
MAETTTGSALARALAKAQGVMAGASKDKTNPAFKSRYADLASVWDACREPLTSNGLAVVQLVTAADKASVTVETRLLHESGESVSSVLTMPVEKPTAQGVGSAITYARRYALSALVGVAPDDDDDGNAASGVAPRNAPASRPPSVDVAGGPPQLEHRSAEVVPFPDAIGEWCARVEAADTLAALTAVGKAMADDRDAKRLRENARIRSAYTARMTAMAAREKAGGGQ